MLYNYFQSMVYKIIYDINKYKVILYDMIGNIIMCEMKMNDNIKK